MVGVETRNANRDSKPHIHRGAFVDAIAGAISGCISRFVVGPLDVIKIRFQIQIEPMHETLNKRHGKYHSVWQALRTIKKEEGLIVTPSNLQSCTPLLRDYGEGPFLVSY